MKPTHYKTENNKPEGKEGKGVECHLQVIHVNVHIPSWINHNCISLVGNKKTAPKEVSQYIYGCFGVSPCVCQTFEIIVFEKQLVC